MLNMNNKNNLGRCVEQPKINIQASVLLRLIKYLFSCAEYITFFERLVKPK